MMLIGLEAQNEETDVFEKADKTEENETDVELAERKDSRKVYMRRFGGNQDDQEETEEAEKSDDVEVADSS